MVSNYSIKALSIKLFYSVFELLYRYTGIGTSQMLYIMI